MSESPFLTAKQVAAELGMSVWFVYDHPSELGLVKIGGANRYRRSHVEHFIAQLVAEAEAPTPPPASVTPLRSVPAAPARSSSAHRRRRVPLLEPERRAA